MALITRISRLFKADFHAVLDQIEEPEQLLRQAIREMEDDLDATEHDHKLSRMERMFQRMRRHDRNGAPGMFSSVSDSVTHLEHRLARHSTKYLALHRLILI